MSTLFLFLIALNPCTTKPMNEAIVKIKKSANQYSGFKPNKVLKSEVNKAPKEVTNKPR